MVALIAATYPCNHYVSDTAKCFKGIFTFNHNNLVLKVFFSLKKKKKKARGSLGGRSLP